MTAAGLRVEGVYGVEGPGWLVGGLDDLWDDASGRGRRSWLLRERARLTRRWSPLVLTSSLSRGKGLTAGLAVSLGRRQADAAVTMPAPTVSLVASSTSTNEPV